MSGHWSGDKPTNVTTIISAQRCKSRTGPRTFTVRPLGFFTTCAPFCFDWGRRPTPTLRRVDTLRSEWRRGDLCRHTSPRYEVSSFTRRFLTLHYEHLYDFCLLFYLYSPRFSLVGSPLDLRRFQWLIVRSSCLLINCTPITSTEILVRRRSACILIIRSST